MGDWAEKKTADFVSFVDREAEQEVVRRITADFPEHRILAEEGTAGTVAHAREALEASGPDPERGSDGPDDSGGSDGPDWLWVIDPLDGTTNFLHGYPAYSASVAVLRDGSPEAGAVIAGATGEEWWAARGEGAFMDGGAIRVSEIDRMPQALIGTGFPFKVREHLPRYLQQLDRVIRATSGVRRGGSAALDLCHIASGYFDGFWELVLAPWDIAAGTIIVREAGGLVTTMRGDAGVVGGGSVLAGNPAIHPQLQALLREPGYDDAEPGAPGAG